MFSASEVLITITILLLNFAIIALLRNKIVIVASVMISNLITILFYSLIISDNQILKELIIATTIYCITILTLISNSHHIDKIREYSAKKSPSKIIISFIFLVSFGASCCGFYLIKHINFKQQIDVKTTTNTTMSITQAKQDLKNNVLFKRSTDAILIVVGIMTILLLSSKYRNRESNI